MVLKIVTVCLLWFSTQQVQNDTDVCSVKYIQTITKTNGNCVMIIEIGGREWGYNYRCSDFNQIESVLSKARVTCRAGSDFTTAGFIKRE